MRRKRIDATPIRSVNRSLASKNRTGSGYSSSESSSRALAPARWRKRGSRNRGGESIGPPTTPTITGSDHGMRRESPNGGTPGARRNSRPPPRMAATPPSPPPPKRSPRWAISMAFARGPPSTAETASAVAVAPAALIPNPCPIGKSWWSRTVSKPWRVPTSRRATSVEMGNSSEPPPRMRRRRVAPGRQAARATTPSSSTTPAPREPRARGSGPIEAGAKMPVTWPGANARAVRIPCMRWNRFPTETDDSL